MTKVVFFGNERLVSGLEKTNAPILLGLIEHGYDVVAVVSHHSFTKSRTGRELEVAEIAKKHNIPLFLPSRPLEIIEDLRNLDADIAVLASYGRIISQEIINLFKLGIVNVHPSLLPKYRGPTPIESAILHGDHETGVSIMQLTAGMDEGPIYAQSSLDLNGSETKFELYEKIVELSTPLFFDTLSKIVAGSIQPTQQDDTEATYSRIIDKKDGLIDWNKPAMEIEREIRAYIGWPQSQTVLKDIHVIITKAHIESGSETAGDIILSIPNKLLIGTGKDLLAIDSLKPSGKKEMPASAFLAGYRSKLSN